MCDYHIWHELYHERWPVEDISKTDYRINDQSIAVVPLAIPIMAGPGTIAAALSEVHHTFNIWYQKVIISVIVLGITLFVFY